MDEQRQVEERVEDLDVSAGDAEDVKGGFSFGVEREFKPGIALDKIEHMRTDFAALVVAGFRFIRLDPQMLFDGFAVPDRFVPANEIYQRATLAGLSIIADGVVDAKTQKRLLEVGVDLGQGALFGVPRQVMLDDRTKHSAAA